MKTFFRSLCYVGALALAGSATSCLTPPDYSNTPTISVESITSTRLSNIYGVRDTIVVALNFQDGDGDLGLGGPTAPSSDAEGVYAFNNGTNRYNKNYFIQPYYRAAGSTGAFVPLETTTPAIIKIGDYYGRYPRLTDNDTKAGPLKGVLRFGLVLGLSSFPFSANTEYQFQVSIADRALHESNVVTTPIIKL